MATSETHSHGIPPISKYGLVVMLAALLIPLLIYAAGAVHIRYMADDYCRIANARQVGVVGNIMHAYRTFFGAYTTMAIISIAGLIGLAIEPVILITTLVIWWLLLFDLMRRLVQWRNLPNPGWLGAIAASLLAVAVLSGAPNIYQSLYWPISRSHYFISLVLMTLEAWLLVRAHHHGRINPALLALIAGLAILLGGFAISYSLVSAALWGMALLLLWHQRPLNRYLAAAFTGALIGLAAFVLAPGNAVRQSYFPAPDLLFTLQGTLGSLGWPGIMSAWQSPFATLAIVVLPFMAGRYLDHGTLSHPLRTILLIPVLVIGLVGICFAPAFYAMSKPLPGRIWILPQTITLTGLMGWTYAAGIITRKGRLRAMPRWMRAGIWLLIMAVAVSATQDALTVNRELARYAAAWDERDRILRAVEHPDAPVTVPVFEHVFGLEGITPDPDFWVNTCVANYYGLSQVIGVDAQNTEGNPGSMPPAENQ
ncbi:MAG: hypothetical protein Kow0077_29050 [Anaerolineae bacterium]